MKHWLLIYEVGPEYMERRAEFRGVHLKLAWEAADRGELLLGGALQSPNGLVQRWSVREWTTVAGEGAANPIRP